MLGSSSSADGSRTSATIGITGPESGPEGASGADGGPEGVNTGDGPLTGQVLSVRSVLLGSGPRFVRDIVGPLLTFYVGWKLAGVVVGVVAATLFATLAWGYERRHERPGLVARLALALVIVNALIGLGTHSATIYLAQPLLVGATLGAVFIVSTLFRRPLAGVFAVEMFPFTPEIRASNEYRQIFGRVSLAWGAYLLLHAAFLLVVLVSWGVDVFVVANISTGAPIIATLLTWSVWYTVASFRRSEEWGSALREAEG